MTSLFVYWSSSLLIIKLPSLSLSTSAQSKFEKSSFFSHFVELELTVKILVLSIAKQLASDEIVNSVCTINLLYAASNCVYFI